MKIVLMRHGRPELDLDALLKQRVSAAEVGKIVKEYEMSDLAKNQKPSLSALDEVKAAGYVISSDLPRAVQSVEELQGHDKLLIDSSFRESSLPYFISNWPRLSLFTYFLLFRLAWLLGFSSNGESIRDARKRAASNASKLLDLARAHGSVVLLGHGIMNRLIARELKRSGMVCSEQSKEKYWSYAVFQS